MKKILITAHYSRFLVQFELNDVKLLQKMGFEVHYAANFKNEDMYKDAIRIIKKCNVITHHIDFIRSPYKISENLIAYKQLVKVMTEEKFYAVHTHTPMVGFLTRLAAKRCKIKHVLYTAHGFHFYRGCPLINLVIYKPVEKFMARITDAIITINQEDYLAACKFKSRGKVYKIPGVGVNVKKIIDTPCEKEHIMKKLGVKETSFVFISVGELNKNKNQEITLRAFAEANLKDSIYILCGEGERKNYLTKISTELGIEDKVFFVGFQSNIPMWLKASDVLLFPSIREGLGLAGIEGLAAGLPVILADNRGSREYYNESIGSICNPGDKQAFVKAMRKWYIEVITNKSKIQKRAENVALEFSIEKVEKKMQAIYMDVLN